MDMRTAVSTERGYNVDEASESQRSREPQTFYFDWTDRLAGVFGGFVAAAGCSLLLWIGWNEPGAVLLSKLVFIFGAIFMLLLAIGAALRMSPIEVSDIGMRRLIMGRTWRSLKWSDAKRIRFGEANKLDNVGGPRIRIYFVDATVRLQFPFAPGGPIFFNSKIHEFEMLRELVTHYATKHSIPIFDHRSGGPGERVDRL